MAKMPQSRPCGRGAHDRRDDRLASAASDLPAAGFPDALDRSAIVVNTALDRRAG
jgi:hypothetical protein